jgi:signal transduction histidine kinase/DNA-binding response OmpR family regulator
MKKFTIIILNVVIICAVVLSIIFYTKDLEVKDRDEACSAFETTTHAMEGVASSDLGTAESMCLAWANYINANDMTISEALTSVEQAMVGDESVQIIGFDSLEGLASGSVDDSGEDAKISYSGLDVIDTEALSENDGVLMTSEYKNPADGTEVVAFYTHIYLLDENGKDLDAILLRIVPVENLLDQWEYPVNYDNVDVAIIDKDGKYAMRTDVFSGDDFWENLGDEGYDESGQMRVLDLVDTEEMGSFELDENKHEGNFYAFSTVSLYEDWIFVARIEENSLYTSQFDWTVPGIIIFALTIALIINIIYFRSVFKQQKEQLETINRMAEEEKAQKELVTDALNQAKAANMAKNAFFSNMSHDIRTPLNGVVGMTAIAGTHLTEPERVADCLHKITVASKHLLGLINEVLDMSKIESGNLELTEEAFQLSSVFDNVISMTRSQIEEHNHELVVSIDNVTHEKVIGDSLRLQQVFMNLMSNAIKYTPDGGVIKFRIAEKHENQKKVGMYEVVVEDNGIGMTPEFASTIFDPFTRAMDTKMNKVQGTGLGMSIVNNIIHMMDGEIKVETELGKGSKFTVYFCLRLQEEDEASYDEFIDLPVLVADDDEVSCEYACNMLNDLGMKSEWVLSGDEAVKAVLKKHEEKDDYFAVIIDWKMPDMSGVETTKSIRDAVGEDVPIIIISAFDWADIEQEARRAGANAFISKPLFKSRMVYLFQSLVGEVAKEEEVINEQEEESIKDIHDLDLKGRKVLLVEDNELNAEIAEEILEMSGLEVVLAEDGLKAVQIMTTAFDGEYDLIIMDIQMPVMNGYDATRAIRHLGRRYTDTVPIVAMSANAFAEDVMDARNAGMNGHIPKPFDMNMLLDVLQKWVL